MAEVVLRVDDVVFRPGGRRGAFALRVPRFAPEPGVHLLVGLNGSGKSTVSRLLSGIVVPDAGVVTFRGRPLDDEKVMRAYSAASGYLGQDFELRGRTPVRAYLAWRAWLKGFGPRQAYERADESVQAAGLEDVAEAAVGALSGGWQRRVGIAAETLGRPEVLVLDEPTSGLDLDARDAFYRTLAALVSTEATVILAAHELADLDRFDATVHALVSGRFSRSVRVRAGELDAATLRDLVHGEPG